jgi:hypothetical protein
MAETKIAQLTTPQLEFMMNHHETIERAYDLLRRGERQAGLEAINALEDSDEYRHVFGEMGWDEAFDRYEDSPSYDPTLRRALLAQLQVENGHHENPPPSVENNHQKTIGLRELRRRLLDE